jgi:DNA repair exonuclease SbcCD ATPase subunit
VLQRMQELIDEANRSDERVALLEEMLHAAEDANRSEREERHQLEAWVGDIENRIGQREDEHHAEIGLVRNQLERSLSQQKRLLRQLKDAASGGDAASQYEHSLEQLQQSNQELQEALAEAQKESLSLQQQVERSGEQQEQLLREERAKIAQEQAKVARLRFELTAKLSAIEELPKPENNADNETSARINALRQHLREIHEQEKQAEREAPLTRRLVKLWKRVDEY